MDSVCTCQHVQTHALYCTALCCTVLHSNVQKVCQVGGWSCGEPCLSGQCKQPTFLHKLLTDLAQCPKAHVPSTHNSSQLFRLYPSQTLPHPVHAGFDHRSHPQPPGRVPNAASGTPPRVTFNPYTPNALPGTQGLWHKFCAGRTVRIFTTKRQGSSAQQQAAVHNPTDNSLGHE